MAGARNHLAPAVPIQQSVDRRGRHLLARFLLVGLLDLCNLEHAASTRLGDERRQDQRLFLGTQVLMVSSSPAAHLENGVAFLGPARMHHMDRRC